MSDERVGGLGRTCVPSRWWVPAVCVSLALVSGFVAGRVSAPVGEVGAGGQLNAMLADGWVMVDPDGFEVSRFDE